MKKKDREIIFNKYGGKCAYCGCKLEKGWHVDHLVPIRRINDVVQTKDFKWKVKTVGFLNPEANNIDNLMPSCASCNINKHSSSLEDFRNLIKGFMKHLNKVNTQYKIAKRYGLVSENDIEVKFYFEKLPINAKM